MENQEHKPQQEGSALMAIIYLILTGVVLYYGLKGLFM